MRRSQLAQRTLLASDDLHASQRTGRQTPAAAERTLVRSDTPQRDAGKRETAPEGCVDGKAQSLKYRDTKHADSLSRFI